jgi:hypothetical protein
MFCMTENAEMYCKFGVPFVMGTTGGDRELLYKTVRDSNVYAVISPQMGKQVISNASISLLFFLLMFCIEKGLNTISIL